MYLIFNLPVKAQKRKWEEEKAMKKIQKKMDIEKETEDKIRRQMEEREQRGRDWTVSIALPGSIVDNAQSDELRTYVAGQVCVDLFMS